MVCYDRITCNIGVSVGICLCLLCFAGFVTVGDANTQPPPHPTFKYLREFRPTDYNEATPPTEAYYGPKEVNDEFKAANRTKKIEPWVQLTVQPFYVTSMSMIEMDFTVHAEFKVTWEDSRINDVEDIFRGFKGPPPRAVAISKFIKAAEQSSRFPNIATIKLWLPDIIFSNCRGASDILISPQQSLADINVRINTWIQRLSVDYRLSNHFFCDFAFKKYPFDEQKCSIQFSFEHSEHDHMVKWSTEVFIEDISNIRVPPEYELSSLTVSRCANKSNAEHHLIECAEYTFTLRRIYAQHIMLFFVPSILVVLLSWISFWLEESAAPPRVALGLTSILTLATQFSSAQKDLPSVADIKAIDIWMFACMFMVFASLVEFAIANYNNRKKISSTPAKQELPEEKLLTKPPQSHKLTKQPQIQPQPKYVYSVFEKTQPMTNNFLEDSQQQKQSQKQRPKILTCFSRGEGNKIDRLSRIIFPMAFLIFNIIFWTYFTAQ